MHKQLKALSSESSKAVTYELPLINQGDNVFVSAILLHRKLRVQTAFHLWFKRRIDKYGFEDGVDFCSNLNKSTGGRNATDYLLSLDMAKEISMLEENEIGRSIRKYFIAKEKELRGVSQLPKESQLFKGLKAKTFNGRKMYGYCDVLERCGYSRRSYGDRRLRYWMHFVKEGKVNYISEEYALHLYHSKQVFNNRKTMLATQPVLPLNFGTSTLLNNNPLLLKSSNHGN